MAAIAIDYTSAYEQGGGIGRMTRELVAALAQQDTETDYRLFVAGAAQQDLPPPPGHNFSWHPTRVSPLWLARLWHRARVPLPVSAFTGRTAIYHATDFVLPPVLPGTRTLVTVHDLSFIRVPHAASPRLKAYLEQVVPRSIARADHIIANSQATKNDVVTLYRTHPSKITIMTSGISAHFRPVSDAEERQRVRQKYHLSSKPYLLCVGTVQPRKNYSRVVEALALLRRQGHDVMVVIAGGKGWLEDEMFRTIAATQMHDHVRLIGFADDADLPALYSDAACFLFPSLYEGFGFPVLEAMTCGTPVVTSNLSSLPEVAGDAALLVDPLDASDIARATASILEDAAARDALIQRGYRHVQHYTWARAAQQVRSAYEALLA